MSQLEVLFEVPRFIEAGLANGTFQRVGGVIVDSSSKQVVAWLRDGTMLDVGARVASSALNPLGLVLQAAQTATSLVDGHFTRQAINTLGQTVQANHVETMNALNAIGQSVQTIGALTMLTATGQLLNLAMTAASFRAISKRLERLSASIDELGQRIIAEFDRNRDVAFQVALQDAREAFESEQELTRSTKAIKAQSELLAARKHFMIDFENTLGIDQDRNRLPLAQHYLIRAMYAEISRIRCYLASGDDKLAKSGLAEEMPHFEEKVKTLIDLWLGHHAAIYFHKKTPSTYLSRFLRIQQWLRGVESGNDAYILFEILDVYRDKFWDQGVVDAGNLLHRYSTMFSPREEERLIGLANNLSQVELLIENMERLWGFEMEVRTMRLSFDEWSHLVSDEEIEENGIGLIVDNEIAQQYAHLEA